MRNPFRRQIETAAPTLRERAANLRASLRPAPVAPAPLPAPGSEEAKAAWQAACHEHSVRTAPLHDCPKLMSPTGDVWTKRTLAEALETGRIAVSEYARLYPLASERELRFDQIGHELNTASLFALAFADEYREKAAEPRAADRKPDDLTAAMLDGWAAWGATVGNLEDSTEAMLTWERASAERDRLLYAAMDLPATPASIPAKALACAWMEWVCAEQPGKPRDAYGPADQLVYDIHATIMARGVESAASRPTELPVSALVPTIDFAGASMSELRAIRNAADLVCSVASAATWQGSNHLPDHPSGASRHNRAGELMVWLGDALGFVVGAAQAEARRRTPENEHDRNTRLAILAESTIENGDPAQTAAFARELLATVEA